MSELLYGMTDHWLVLRGDGGGDGGGGDGGGDSGDAGGASGGDSGGDTGGAPSSDSGVAPDGSPDAAPSEAADLSPDVTADTSAQDQGLAPGSFATQGQTGEAATGGQGFGGGFGTGEGGMGGPSIDAFSASTGPGAVASGAPAVGGGFSGISDALSPGSDDPLSSDGAITTATGASFDPTQGVAPDTPANPNFGFNFNGNTLQGSPDVGFMESLGAIDPNTGLPVSQQSPLSAEQATALMASNLGPGLEFGPGSPTTGGVSFGDNPATGATSVATSTPGAPAESANTTATTSDNTTGGGGGGSMPSILGSGADQQNINDFLNTFGGGSQTPGIGTTSVPGAGGIGGGLNGDEFAGGSSFGGGGGPRISGNAGATGGIQLADGDVLSADALAAGPSSAGDALASGGAGLGGGALGGAGSFGAGSDALAQGSAPVAGSSTLTGIGSGLSVAGALGSLSSDQQQQVNTIAGNLLNQARQMIMQTYGVAPEQLPQWPAILAAIQQQAQNQVLTGTPATQPLR